jgi:hypothetical protein
MGVMRSTTRILLLLILMMAWKTVFAQEDYAYYEEAYQRAKRIYQEGRYDLAAATFKTCAVTAPNNPFEAYAHFYMALAAYRSGYTELSYVRFRQALMKFPRWEKSDELRYWVSRLAYEQGRLLEGLSYEYGIISEDLRITLEPLKTKVIDDKSEKVNLESIYDSIQDPFIARKLIQEWLEKDIKERDNVQIDSLISAHGFTKMEFGLADVQTSKLKDVYHVGIFLPFFYDTATNQPSSSFVQDLYQGILKATEDLNGDGPEILIHAFDTRADSLLTRSILKTDQLKNLDLIIGPLYSQPRKVISEFSRQYQINMVNPLSDNEEVIGNNPFSFLFQASAMTKAENAAKFAVDVYSNPHIFIIYEDNQKHHRAALLYRGYMEENGFVVMDMVGEAPENAGDIRAYLTRTYFDQDGYKTDSLVIQPDSIGHIFVSASNVQIGANVISAVAQRGDKIPVIGDAEWLNYPFFDREQLSNENIYLLGSNYLDLTDSAYLSFQQKTIQENGSKINPVFIQGYSCLYFFGSALKKHGTHFQVSFKPGVSRLPLLNGVNFYQSNDNQYVPMFELEDLRIQPVVLDEAFSRHKVESIDGTDGDTEE